MTAVVALAGGIVAGLCLAWMTWCGDHEEAKA